MTFVIRLLFPFDWVIGRRPGANCIAKSKRPPGGHLACWVVIAASLLAGLAQEISLHAQTNPATLPDLQLSVNGTVTAMALQNDGKVIIGGNFWLVNGVPRNYLARLNPNGSVDATWNGNVSGEDPHPSIPVCGVGVYAIIVSGSDVFVGGDFCFIGGRPQAALAKLSLETGEVDPLWTPHLLEGGTVVYSLGVQDTNLFVGGYLKISDGQSPRSVMKRSTVGAGEVDPLWNPEVFSQGGVKALAVNNTNVYIGGDFFINAGGTRIVNLARLSATGTGAPDPMWNPRPLGGLKPSNPPELLPRDYFLTVNAIAVNGMDVYVGGMFTNISGVNRSAIAKLSSNGTGAADPLWNPNATGRFDDFFVNTLAVYGAQLYVGGAFTAVGGQLRTNLARLSTGGTGVADPKWNPNPGKPNADSSILALAVNDSGSYAGGDFETVGGVSALALARLDPLTGARDETFPTHAGRAGYPSAIVRLPDGKLIIGGWFVLAGGLPRRNLVRVNADGTVDPTWIPDPNNGVIALAVSGADLYVGGRFDFIGGKSRRGLAKLRASGTDAVDPDWNPSCAGQYDYITALAASSTGVFVAGFFTNIGGQARTNLAKLDPGGEGLADPAWNPNPSGDQRGDLQRDVLVLDGTNLYVCGEFDRIGGQTRTNLAKLSTTGAGLADALWNPNPIGAVQTIVVSGTEVYVGGYFSAIGGQTRGGLAKLGATGSGLADPLWDPMPRYGQFPGGFVRALTVRGTDVYVAGAFDSIGGQAHRNLAKLSAVGNGLADPAWNPNPTGDAWTLLGSGRDVYVGGDFSDIGGEARSRFAFLPVADAPSMVKRSPTSLVVLRNSEDGYEVTHFQINGITGGSLYLANQTNGITQINVGDFITTDQGEAGLIFMGATNGTASAVSSLNATTNGTGTASTILDFGVPQGPVFSFSSASYSVSEDSKTVRVTVRKWGSGPARVTLTTADGTAVAYDLDSDTGDYSPVSTPLNFPDWETNKSFNVGIINDEIFTSDRTFWIALTNETGGGKLAYPATAAITILEDDRFGAAASVTTNQLPAPLPPTSPGALQVFMRPTYGEWRLAGEISWRNSGATADGVVPAIYTVESKPISSYYDLEDITVLVSAGALGQITNSYSARADASPGKLTVLIGPESVTNNANVDLRGQWRLQGETRWRESAEIISNLLAGGYTVEFKRITNAVFSKPLDRQMTVFSGVTEQITVTYVPSPQPGGMTPREMSFIELTDTNWPYLYNGQLQTDAGLSSGVVVKERVVLTVAHALFNDGTLEWVTAARWFFQKHQGDYLPVPQKPRGWYVVGGYAAQRSNDVRNGIRPGYSTPESQQLDAATLYFTETDYDANKPGRGGYGGYLFSDAGAFNEHLLSDRNKFLVGYPLIPGAETNWGRMYATMPANLHFVSLNPKVFRTTDILSYPGNSGGPLYVQWTNGVYYPAGIYLGEGSQTLARAIDGEVVDLINRAEASGNSGGNFTGGGVITISPRYTASGFASGYVQVRLGPPAAVGAGGAWRVSARNIDFTSNPDERIPLAGGGGFILEFREVPGWLSPTTQIVEVEADQVSILDANYVPGQPSLGYRLGEGLRLSGASGMGYRIEQTDSLGSSTDWTLLTNITLTNSTQLIGGTEPTKSATRFFRAVGQ
jgi:Calx-beta domain/Domain of unknown function (DUF5122) beta-propeller